VSKQEFERRWQIEVNRYKVESHLAAQDALNRLRDRYTRLVFEYDHGKPVKRRPRA
jgi:hypothetical protein